MVVTPSNCLESSWSRPAGGKPAGCSSQRNGSSTGKQFTVCPRCLVQISQETHYHRLRYALICAHYIRTYKTSWTQITTIVAYIGRDGGKRALKMFCLLYFLLLCQVLNDKAVFTGHFVRPFWFLSQNKALHTNAMKYKIICLFPSYLLCHKWQTTWFHCLSKKS